jgi:NitT/TauT family transport system substrate-binding protein
MKRSRLVSSIASLALIAFVNGGVLPGAHAAHQRDSASYAMIMNWFPEPEEGGMFDALREGLYQKAGINVTMAPFGYSVVSEQYVVAGKAAFGMGQADEILQYRAKGAKLVAIMSSFQTNPQGIIWHAEDKTVHSLADLSNHTLVYSFGVGYEPYLVLKYHYKNFKTHANDFTSRYFALHSDAVNQCYVTSEPYLWAKQGLKIKYTLIASSGYNPYANLMFTTEDMIQKHPDVVRAFVKASVQGWDNYMKDPAPTNAYMLTVPGAKDYPETPANQMFSYNQMKRLGLVAGGDAATHGIGYFSLARWQTLQKQMVSVGQKVGSVDVTKAFTNQYLPKSSM